MHRAPGRRRGDRIAPGRRLRAKRLPAIRRAYDLGGRRPLRSPQAALRSQAALEGADNQGHGHRPTPPSRADADGRSRSAVGAQGPRVRLPAPATRGRSSSRDTMRPRRLTPSPTATSYGARSPRTSDAVTSRPTRRCRPDQRARGHVPRQAGVRARRAGGGLEAFRQLEPAIEAVFAQP